MKKILNTLLFFFCVNLVNAQLTKNNWLVGGSGSFSFQDQERSVLTVKSTFLDISPNIGYFFVDKIAGGLRVRFQNTRIKNQSVIINSSTLTFGPFIRYYFLPKDHRINVLSELGYSYYDDLRNSSYLSTFNVTAGPVLYFNSSVGLELTANYQHLRSKPADGAVRTFFVAISLQVHLESEK